MSTAEKVWSNTQGLLQTMLNSDIYNLWFAPLRAISLESETLTLEVANDFCELWLKDNYLGLMRDVLMHASGQNLKIVFKIRHGSSPMVAEIPAVKGKNKPDNETLEKASSATVHREQVFNPKNTFDSFVVGETNNHAHAAAVAVAQAPGKSYNPLFLFGGVGLGKTHLLHAIGQHVALHKKVARVGYVSSEKFTNEYIDALQIGRAHV